MANPIVIRVRNEVRGPVGGAIALWSVVTTWCLVLLIAHPDRHSGAAHTLFWSTVALGVILGVQRRTAMAWIAPMVAWAVAWLPVWIAFVVREGFLPGVFVGAVAAAGGWILFGAAITPILFVLSTLVRLIARPFRRSRDVTIISPRDR
jgi:hypothetical protein